MLTGGFVAAVVAVVLLIVVATPEYDRPPAVILAGAPEPSPTVVREAARVDPADEPDSLPPEELTGYRWPLRAARVLAWFGPSKQGFIRTDDGRIHEGIDLASRCEAPVIASHKGTVVAVGRAVLGEVGFEAKRDEIVELEQKHISRSGMKGGVGKDVLPITVVIDDGNGYRSLYRHLADVAVKAGQKVKAGTVIGTTGQSGGVARCQVQYELVRMDGGWQRVAQQEIERMGYPKWIRERIDPLRVLSLEVKGAPKPTKRNPAPTGTPATAAAAVSAPASVSEGRAAGQVDQS